MRQWLCCIAGLATLLTSPAPAQDSGAGQGEGVHSPQIVDREIEASAKAARERGDAPSARFRKFIAAWPDDRDAYTRMANHVVVLISVISQDSRELPVDRLYVRAGGKDLPIRKIWSRRSEVPAGTFAAKMYGRYREDAFYLMPGSRLMSDGSLLADLTARRSGMTVMQLPTEQGRKYQGVLPPGDADRRARMDAATFKALMTAKFPGYPVPKL